MVYSSLKKNIKYKHGGYYIYILKLCELLDSNPTAARDILTHQGPGPL